MVLHHKLSENSETWYTYQLLVGRILEGITGPEAYLVLPLGGLEGCTALGAIKIRNVGLKFYNSVINSIIYLSNFRSKNRIHSINAQLVTAARSSHPL